MAHRPIPRRLSLPAGRHAVLEDARGTRIACADGTLWITQYGDLRDIVLQAGESFVVDRDTKVIVSAVRDTAFALVVPLRRGAWYRRVKRWLLGDGTRALRHLSAS